MTLLQQIREIKSLPVLPEVVNELNNILSGDLGNATELADLISKDAALSALLIKTVNSPLYNFSSNKITNIRDAVVRIGRSEIYTLFLTVSMINTIPSADKHVNYHAYWRHSFTVANLSLYILKQSTRIVSAEEEGELYFSALMHDVGIMLYGIYFPDRLNAVRDRMSGDSSTFLEAELKIAAGDGHAQIGAYLLELWGSSLAVHTTVRYHESPLKAPTRYHWMSSVVSLADRVVNQISKDFPESSSTFIDSNIWEVINISPDKYEIFLLKAEDEYVRAGSLLSTWGASSGKNGNLSSIRSTSSTQLLHSI